MLNVDLQLHAVTALPICLQDVTASFKDKWCMMLSTNNTAAACHGEPAVEACRYRSHASLVPVPYLMAEVDPSD